MKFFIFFYSISCNIESLIRPQTIHDEIKSNTEASKTINAGSLSRRARKNKKTKTRSGLSKSDKTRLDTDYFTSEIQCHDFYNTFFTRFRNFTDIECYLKQLEKDNSDVSTLKTIGQTHEKRNIYSFSITKKGDNDKKLFYFNGGMHSREWISPMSVMYILKMILAKKEEFDDFLSKYIIMLTPMSNPDGYDFSRKKDRYWRKNRFPNGDGTYGVDINRNFDDHYGEVGYSKDTKEENYQGKGANSELETISLTENLKKYMGKMMGGIDYHSYGQSILRNYGFMMEASKNEDLLIDLSEHIKSRILEINDQHYYTDRAAGLYPAGGAFDDWMTQKMGTVSLTIELCPKKGDENGFIYPESKIVYCADGAFTSAVAFMDYLDRNGPFPHNN